MQKILQRAARAKTQYASRQRKLAAIDQRIDTSAYFQEQAAITAEHLALKKQARDRRREDSLLGPLLAPRRDVNFEGKEKAVGTVSLRVLRGAEKPKRLRLKDWGIREGDRVAVTEKGHRDYGKVGIVRELRDRAEECFVKGINLVRSFLVLFFLEICCSPTSLIQLTAMNHLSIVVCLQELEKTESNTSPTP